MHNRFLIYEAGAMAGMTFEQQSVWRAKLKADLEEYDWKTVVFNPVTKYNYDSVGEYDSELEIQRYEMNFLRKADLVIVNLQNKADSIGTTWELAVADHLRIPIVALVEDKTPIHPWVDNACLKKFKTMSELEEYVKRYFLGGL